ncbi:NTP transferase domain-containing protein [Kineosporia sp. J2-2]|uniref:NTP transferase domain-containing protein n=1 Tax=Kineosporia corallincola TaxID=2835133 RepID=A0ABS5TNK4_9ACTN|nr:NTP transferase domain-containing protein [Kineosporia corallincola]MBT0772681.1 NTP transferase domain-containing protein [Kineosporia corallincola]
MTPQRPAMTRLGIVVLAGGSGRRLGGVDKGALVVNGVSLLDGVLLAASSAVRTVVVGEPRPTVRDVGWTREDPPGTGPLAGLAAGVAALRPDDLDLIGVFATDLTGLTPDDVRRLTDALDGPADTGPGSEAAVFVDAEGHRQPLAAVYRAGALRRVLRELQPLEGRPMRALLRALTLTDVSDHGASADCDTPEQLATLRAGKGRDMLEDWVAELGERLSLPVGDVQVAEILDLARDAAHNVDRPAAPLTTFLVGYAAGLKGGGRDEIVAALGEAVRLIESRSAPE